MRKAATVATTASTLFCCVSKHTTRGLFYTSLRTFFPTRAMQTTFIAHVFFSQIDVFGFLLFLAVLRYGTVQPYSTAVLASPGI